MRKKPPPPTEQKQINRRRHEQDASVREGDRLQLASQTLDLSGGSREKQEGCSDPADEKQVADRQEAAVQAQLALLPKELDASSGGRRRQSDGGGAKGDRRVKPAKRRRGDRSDPNGGVACGAARLPPLTFFDFCAISSGYTGHGRRQAAAQGRAGTVQSRDSGARAVRGGRRGRVTHVHVVGRALVGQRAGREASLITGDDVGVLVDQRQDLGLVVKAVAVVAPQPSKTSMSTARERERERERVGWLDARDHVDLAS